MVLLAGSVLNVVLRGPSVASDVQAVLNVDNDYNVDLFMEEIAQVLQSNDSSISDDELEFVVTVAQNRSGDALLKLGNVPYDEILNLNAVEDNSLFLFLPCTLF